MQLRYRAVDSPASISRRLAAAPEQRRSLPARSRLLSPFAVTWLSVFMICMALWGLPFRLLSSALWLVASGVFSFAYLAFDAWYRWREFDDSYSATSIWLVPSIAAFGAIAIVLVTLL